MNVFLRGIDPEMPVGVHALPATDELDEDGDLVAKHALLHRVRFEDFAPWEEYPAVDAFYDLIDQMNAPGSVFAANDCRLHPPKANPYPDMPARLILEGRFILFFRDLQLNLADIVDDSRYEINQNMTDLATGCYEFEYPAYTDSWRSAVELFFLPCIFLDSKPPGAFGQKLSFSFLCYGDDERSLFDGLNLVTASLLTALKQANEEWKVAHPI